MSTTLAKQVSGTETKAKLLDTAEALFALKGYDGVAIRDVTSAAGVGLALAHYHFGSKENLLEQVVARRASALAVRRDAILHAAVERGATYAQILEAFIEPYVEFAAADEVGLRNYCRMLRNVVATERWPSIAARYFDPTAKRYVNALSDVLPHASRARIAEAFSFCITLMISVYGSRERAQTLSDGAVRAGDHDREHRALLDFLVAGFAPLAAEGARQPTPKRAAPKSMARRQNISKSPPRSS